MTPAVHHDPASSLFFVDTDGHRAVLNYRSDGATMTILHTAVPGPIGGRGIAAALTRAAIEFARGSQWRVRPQCSYASAYLRRHTEYSDLLAR